MTDRLLTENGWLPMETPPKGRLIEGLTADGDVDLVEYRETRQCMLASVAHGAGECGPGWVSAHADYLPVDPPVGWRERTGDGRHCECGFGCPDFQGCRHD